MNRGFYLDPRGRRLSVIGLLVLLLLAGCEQQIADNHYKAGYEKGYADGNAAGHSQGYSEGQEAGYAKGLTAGKEKGYADAYEQFTPGTKHGYSSIMGVTFGIFALLGALKILVSISVLAFVLFKRSNSGQETAAKILFGIAGTTVALFTLPLLGIQGAVDAILSAPSPSNTIILWLIQLGVAAATYVLARLVESLFGYLHGVWIEVWSMFALAAFSTLIIHSLGKFIFYSPDINDYFGSNILVGVFVGGIMFIAVKLVEEAIARR